MRVALLNFLLFLSGTILWAQTSSEVWQPLQNDGTYKNPIIHADYSDPDAIRVGEDYYMIASSFNAAPALPILHSKNLVNWTLIGHALKHQFPLQHYSNVQHGGGVWAPSIRYHKKEFHIYYPDPDFGIYLIKSKSIHGPWTMPLLVKEGKGLIDPCPLWDNDGKTYLTYALAGSRAGVKSILLIQELSHDGTAVINEPVMVYDGHNIDPTVEGPKLYKRNGYYYILAPAGGVSSGWQLALRSKNIYGPYERKIVMAQGNTDINGPHQGAWINTPAGEDWFLHFQDKEAYGRIVHLQPMQWKNDWPIIGADPDGDGTGEPVLSYRIPSINNTNRSTPQDSDEFSSIRLGLQWQWQANPQHSWAFTTPHGTLRLFSVKSENNLANYWSIPNILHQKFPAEQFTATTKITFTLNHEQERLGLIIFGSDYAHLSLVKENNEIYITYNQCIEADKNKLESELFREKINSNTIYLQSSITPNAQCIFSYSTDGQNYQKIHETFTARPGRWVGAKIGLFFTRTNITNDAGYADIDWFRFE